MIVCEGERCKVEGALTMTNATAVLAESERAFQGPRIVVDLAGVTEVDSSALSLLLEWRRRAAADNRAIEYANLPENLKTLAALYGISELLPAS